MSLSDTTGWPPALRTILRSELEPGEAVTWAAQPIAGRMARRRLATMAFGLAFIVFSLAWIHGATQGPAGYRSLFGGLGWTPLVVAPSMLLGMGMVMSPFWAYSRARRSAYALTDRRAILIGVDGLGRTRVTSFAPGRPGDLRRDQRPDGSGDLTFTKAVRWRSGGRRASGQVGFLAIADVKRVEDMVRVLAAKSAS